jgi:hypothetical protein
VRGVQRGRVGVMRGADRLPEIGERDVNGEIKRKIVVQETEVFAGIAG